MLLKKLEITLNLGKSHSKLATFKMKAIINKKISSILILQKIRLNNKKKINPLMNLLVEFV
jgi:hypothetical protein